MTDDIRLPDHHRPGGGFRNPWPIPAAEKSGGVLRWQLERFTKVLPRDPKSEDLPLATPQVLRPRAERGNLRATWIGHATWLIQIGPLNILTDPHFSERASPFSTFGPRRFVPPGVSLVDLPEIDVVVFSHDHYDHLDRPTVDRLAKSAGKSAAWVTPLAYRRWFARRGITVTEMDWWETLELQSRGAKVRLQCLPAQHWTSRTPRDRFRRLWASWALETDGWKVYFGGDSGYFQGYAEIGRDAGPFDLVLLPIGAYEPRWFMRPFHMNPEDAVRAYLDLGANGVFAAMHWGTFRLTDEDPLEPPARIRQAWLAAGLEPSSLWVPAHAETRAIKKIG